MIPTVFFHLTVSDFLFVAEIDLKALLVDQRNWPFGILTASQIILDIQFVVSVLLHLHCNRHVT